MTAHKCHNKQIEANKKSSLTVRTYLFCLKLIIFLCNIITVDVITHPSNQQNFPKSWRLISNT